jgi:hypothetical protein
VLISANADEEEKRPQQPEEFFNMTSEEMGFGTQHTTLSTIVRLVGVTCVVCAVFVGAMYFVGKGNTQSVSAQQETTVAAQVK